jgi:hypothetical protein
VPIDTEQMSNEVWTLLALTMRARADSAFPGVKEEDTPSEEVAFAAIRHRLAESLRNRFDSILFHLAWLTIIEAEHRDVLQSMEAPSSSRVPIRIAVTQVYFVFDDIVMLIITFFDYFAQFAAATLVGPRRARMSWADLCGPYEIPGMERSAVGRTAKRRAEPQDYPDFALRESRVARLARSENPKWLKGLAHYRGGVVHAVAQEPQGTLVRDLLGNEVSIHPHTPPEFILYLPDTPGGPSGGPAEIGATAEWLIDRAFLLARSLCLALEDDLRGMES